MMFLVVQTLLALAFLAGRLGEAKVFSYNLNHPLGPLNWGGDCGSGKRQSPIDIKSESLTPLKANILRLTGYDQTVTGALQNKQSVFVKFDQHTDEDEAVVIVSDGFDPVPQLRNLATGEVFSFLQLHFHWPSEHTIDGKNTAAEFHLVHQSEAGNLAVLGVLYELGSAHQQTRTVRNIGEAVSSIEKYGASTNITFNLREILPNNLEWYYHYAGSLTTPPCSEIVDWFVMGSTPIIDWKFISNAKRLQGSDSTPLGFTNRPVQTNKEYLVHEYNRKSNNID